LDAGKAGKLIFFYFYTQARFSMVGVIFFGGETFYDLVYIYLFKLVVVDKGRPFWWITDYLSFKSTT